MKWLFFISIFLVFVSYGHKNSLAQNNGQVSKIEVDGNVNIEKEEVVKTLKTYIGEEIDRKKLQKGIASLYELGFFEDVKMRAVETDEGIAIITTVQEKPELKNLRFRGNKFVSPRLIQRVLMLQPQERKFVDRKLLDNCTDRILRLYRDSGYYFARAYPRAEIDEKTNEASVTYMIEEGKRIKVKRIMVAGNKRFASGEILKSMSTKAGGFFSNDIFSDEELSADIKKISSLYHSDGYIKAKVSHSLFFDEKNEHVAILIVIDEGIRYSVGKISARGNTALEGAKFEELFLLKEGEVFNHDKLLKGINNLNSFYSRNGFLLSRIEYALTYHDNELKADVEVKIIENNPYTINRIIVKGNQKTKERIIKRFLLVREQEIFDGYKIFLTQRRLQELGYFKKVSILTQQTKFPDKRDLLIDLEEGGTNMFEAGLKYSTAYDLGFYARFDEKNLFGRAQRLTLKSQVGGKKENVTLSFIEPYLFERDLRLKTDLYGTELNIPRRYFKERRAGGDIIFTKPLFGYTFGNLSYRFEEVKVFDVGTEVSDYILPGKTNLASVTGALVRDTRDSYFYPLRGSLNSVDFETSGDFLGSDYNFIKSAGESNYYFNLLGQTVFLVRLRLGIVSGFNEKKVPLFERFYLGGANTIRGYEEGEIAPRFGGKAMGIVNLEYRIPLTKNKTFINSLFYDAGNSWEAIRDLDIGDLKQGLGTALTYNSRFGRVGLTYGYGIDKHKDEIYVNIGNNF